MNFFKDAVATMQQNDVKPEDVEFVRHECGHCSWEDFARVMQRHDGDYNNYDKSRGEFAIVGKDWILEHLVNYEDECYSFWHFASLKRPERLSNPIIDDFIQFYKYTGEEHEEYVERRATL